MDEYEEVVDTPKNELDSPIWQNLPQDLIDEVVSWLIAELHWGETFWGLRRVCRHWYQRFIPVRCEEFVLPRGADAARLVPIMQSPHWSYREVKDLCFKSTQHLFPSTLNKLSPLMPSLEILEFGHIDWRDEKYAHPSWCKLFAVSLKNFKHVTKLELYECRFQNSQCILYLLAALPSLCTAKVSSCEWSTESLAIPSRRCNQFKELILPRWNRHYNLEYLFPIWSLPHRTRHELATDIYPGIKYKECCALAKLLVGLIHRVGPNKMNLERSVYPLLWTLVIRVYDGIDIEVTVSRDDDDSQGYVRWIKFRRSPYSDADAIASTIANDGENIGLILAFGQFSHLEKIVLEDDEGKYCTLPASWKPLKDKLHIWSTAKAKAYAQYVKENGFPSQASDQFPVSPKKSEDDDDSEDDEDNVAYTDEEWAVCGEELEFQEENPWLVELRQIVAVENADEESGGELSTGPPVADG